MTQVLNTQERVGGYFIAFVVIIVTECFIQNSEIFPNMEISSHGQCPAMLTLKEKHNCDSSFTFE